MRFMKITRTQWYQESARITCLSGQKMSMNVIISLGLLVALAVSACIAH